MGWVQTLWWVSDRIRSSVVFLVVPGYQKTNKYYNGHTQQELEQTHAIGSHCECIQKHNLSNDLGFIN